MRILHWKIALFISSSLFIASCSTTNVKNPTQMATNLINRQSVTPLTHQTYPEKTPTTVALYTNDTTPSSAYRIIGIAQVSKYNIFGVSRQPETMNAMMKKLAASIGGDGLIDVNQTDKGTEAKVIAYQKILL